MVPGADEQFLLGLFHEVAVRGWLEQRSSARFALMSGTWAAKVATSGAAIARAPRVSASLAMSSLHGVPPAG